MYNESCFNVTSVADYGTCVNTESGMILGAVILLVVWVVLFVVTKLYDTKVSLLVSSFITSILAIFLCFGLHWISTGILLIPIVLTMFAVVINIAWKD
jgi:hypothetical protein